MMLSRLLVGPYRIVRWLSLVGGAVWGLAAARTLALDLHWAFCYSLAAAVLGALLGGLAAAVLGSLLRVPPGQNDSRLLTVIALYLPLADLLSATYQPWRGPLLLLAAPLTLGLIYARPTRAVWLSLAVFIPLAVYLTDVSPYVGRADTFEFQVVGPKLGIAHPSGYPLYTLLCKLASLVPFGSIAWRVNITSACFAALASGALYLSLDRRKSEPGAASSGFLALVAALMMAFSPTLWSRAIEAEVYALNALLISLGLLLVTLWTDGKLQTRLAWPAFGLLTGLALASHITLGALAFLALAGLLAAKVHPAGRTWIWAIGLGILGLMLYAYIPLRWPAETGGAMMSPTDLGRYVLNAGSGGALRPLAFLQDGGRWALVGRLLREQVGWFGLVFAAIGLLSLGRDRPWIAAGTLASFAAWVWFSLSFYVAEPDYSAFLIPAHVVLTFWLGLGMQMLNRAPVSWGGLRGSGAARAGYLTAVVGPGLAAFALLFGLRQIWTTGPTLDTLTQGRTDESWARYVLQLPLDQDAAILADSEKFPPLYYLQQIEGVRPDLELVTLFSEQQYREALEQRLGEGRRVYLARYLPGMDAYGVSSVGPLVAVGPDTTRISDEDGSVSFGSSLELLSSQILPDPLSRPLVHVTLTWGAMSVVREDLEVRFRLVDSDGAVLWETNEGRPVSGYTTTQAWAVGAVVDDYHAVAWPDWVPAGDYSLEVGLFPRFEDDGLPAGAGDIPWHALGPVTVGAQGVEPSPPRLEVLVDGATWLLGANYPTEVQAGMPLNLDLVWLCREPGTAEAVTTNLTSAVGSNDFSGSVPGEGILALRWVPADGSRPSTDQPLFALGQGDRTTPCVTTAQGPTARRYSVVAPPMPGSYHLEIVGPQGAGVDASLRCNWPGPAQDGCSLGVVTVAPAAAGPANFDNRILLLEADFDAGGVPAGGPLSVNLTWRPLQSLALDYTVFVQVLGPDGKLYGQVDSWPVQGARPTSGWQPSEEIADPYRFYVKTDGPAGDYKVVVGWYLLADMTRLPLVDATGHAIGDFYVVGTFRMP